MKKTVPNFLMKCFDVLSRISIQLYMSNVFYHSLSGTWLSVLLEEKLLRLKLPTSLVKYWRVGNYLTYKSSKA